MSRILMPEYLLNFARDIYEGPLPSNFGERLIDRKDVQVLENLYKIFGGKIPTNQGKRMVPNYLLLFIQNLANADILEVVDDDVAYIKETPQNALKYAFLNKVGGMSYKCNNYFNSDIENGSFDSDGSPADSQLRVRTKDFIEITPGTYTISWTTTNNINNIVIYAYNSNNVIVSSDTIQNWQARNPFTFTLNIAVKVKFAWKNGNDIEVNPNQIDNIMLNSGSTSLPFEPFFEGIRDSKVTSINDYVIPNEVQSLQGYGQSDPDDDTAYNYIDFDTKEFIRVGYIDNGIWVESSLTTDISSYIDDNIIDVSNNLTFNNEYEQAVPSEITYYVRS